MNRFFRGVLSHRKFVIALFVCCAIAGAILSLGVKVNYTFADYLPQNTASTVALETMNEEFDGGAPNARLVIPDVTIPEAQATIKYITMKLDENERSSQIRLMKVKDMMLEEAHHYSERA